MCEKVSAFLFAKMTTTIRGSASHQILCAMTFLPKISVFGQRVALCLDKTRGKMGERRGITSISARRVAYRTACRGIRRSGTEPSTAGRRLESRPFPFVGSWCKRPHCPRDSFARGSLSSQWLCRSFIFLLQCESRAVSSSSPFHASEFRICAERCPTKPATGHPGIAVSRLRGRRGASDGRDGLAPAPA